MHMEYVYFMPKIKYFSLFNVKNTNLTVRVRIAHLGEPEANILVIASNDYNKTDKYLMHDKN